MFFSKKREEAHRKELVERDNKITELEQLAKNLLAISGKTYFLEGTSPTYAYSTYYTYLKYVYGNKVKIVSFIGKKEYFSIIGETNEAYLVFYKDPINVSGNKLLYVSKPEEKSFNVTEFIQRQFLQTEDKSLCKNCSAQKELYDLFERMISRRRAQIKLLEKRDDSETVLPAFIKGFNACLSLFDSALFDLAEHNGVSLTRTETIWMSEASLEDAEKEFLTELNSALKGGTCDGQED